MICSFINSPVCVNSECVLEFGHGLQHMLTRIEHGDAAGQFLTVTLHMLSIITNYLLTDIICIYREQESIILSGMRWSFLLSSWRIGAMTNRHSIETNEPLPRDLFEKIKAAKNFHAGMMMMRQLNFGMTDLTLHSTYDPSGDLTPFDIQREVASRFSVIPPLPEDRFLCGFSHIFAGGYAAGYYSYKWAEVMSADAFGAFEEAGLDNDKAVRETGGSIHPRA